MNVTIRRVFESSASHGNSPFVDDVKRRDIVEPSVNNWIGLIISDIVGISPLDGLRRVRTGINNDGIIIIIQAIADPLLNPRK